MDTNVTVEISLVSESFNLSIKNVTEADAGHGVWNKVVQLVVLSLVSTLGTIGNFFVISAVIVIPILKTKGNAFLVSLAIADLLITALIIPASCLAILAGSHREDLPYYCNFQWQVTIVYYLVASLTFSSISLENLAGVSNVVTYTRCCGSKVKIICVIILTWVVPICVVWIQKIYKFGPDFCNNNFKISVTYHITLAVCLLGLPLLISLLSFFRALLKMKKQEAISAEDQKDPVIIYSLPITDYKLLKSNCIVFSLYIILWLPLCILVGMGIAGRLPKNLVNSVWWVSLSNGCVHSYAYAATNPHFREAFNKLFYYCCCKTHVSFSRIRRQEPRGNFNNDDQSQPLKVHIIQGLNLYAQRKENTSKYGNSVGSSRSAYEL